MARAPALHEIEVASHRLEGFPHPRATSRLYGHETAERTLQTAFASGRMHHGWLIAGPEGIGKATLAYRFAPPRAGRAGRDAMRIRSIFGTGHACRPSGARSRRIQACSSSGAPTTSRPSAFPPLSRSTRSAASRRSSAGRARTAAWRIVIVDRADELNISAANALLKSLEEPPPRTIFLLISSAFPTGYSYPTLTRPYAGTRRA